MLRGQYILTSEWLDACLQANDVVDEEMYEITKINRNGQLLATNSCSTARKNHARMASFCLYWFQLIMIIFVTITVSALLSMLTMLEYGALNNFTTILLQRLFTFHILLHLSLIIEMKLVLSDTLLLAA